MATGDEYEELFSYGTLQLESVQLSTFGRTLAGEPDALVGYCQTKIEIFDPDVIEEFKANYYLNATFTGLETDIIDGTRFKVTTVELKQADMYEGTADYKRVHVTLESGTQSWVYVSANSHGH